MKRKQFIAFVLAVLITLAWVAPASAAARNYWHHSNGHFENTTENKWVEKSPDGTFYFFETNRTDTYVELHNNARNCTVRLFPNRCMVKINDGGWQKMYDGGWGGS
jgi:cellobiose phosphorylase